MEDKPPVEEPKTQFQFVPATQSSTLPPAFQAINSDPQDSESDEEESDDADVGAVSQDQAEDDSEGLFASSPSRKPVSSSVLAPTTTFGSNTNAANEVPQTAQGLDSDTELQQLLNNLSNGISIT